MQPSLAFLLTETARTGQEDGDLGFPGLVFARHT